MTEPAPAATEGATGTPVTSIRVLYPDLHGVAPAAPPASAAQLTAVARSGRGTL
jgi:hypothetical protein